MPHHQPAPVRTDPSNAFANNTMRVRVPATLQTTLETNPDYPDSIKAALAALRDEIAGNGVMRPLALPAPDHDEWAAMHAPHAGETWHNTTWFFAEVFTYRRIIEAVRWWETGRDPFLPIKREEEASPDLWTLIAEALETDGPDLPHDERLLRLLHRALWGNRIDLSFRWSLERGTTIADDDLLLDHGPAVVRRLLDGRGPVHIIADNYGRELAMDLVLVDALLAAIDAPVFLHAKFHPTFVSDATVQDVQRLLWLAADRGPAIGSLADRLAEALNAGRLRVIPEPYWNSARFLADLPPRLQALFSGARLVIAKGDLNYRRLVGDAIWPEGPCFAQAVDGFPAPLAALRTMKSDPLVGLPEGLAAALDARDPDWRWNGKYGVLQSSLE